MLAMKVTALFATTLLSLATAAPVGQERRQLNGLLGSLAGTLGVNQTFDYIVLGGGTAGLTIAKRLAEDPSVAVAVIEAGSVYQVTDPVLEQTPAGDVTFVGTPASLSSLYEDATQITNMKVPRRLSQLSTGGFLPQPTQPRITLSDPMPEESAWAGGMLP
jgi:hypothetical protein